MNENITAAPYLHMTRLKRGVDIVGALIGLILTAPLMLLFGILIYRESPGSVFYKQRRVGMNGREFEIYKLRSMRLDSEVNGVGWTVENDPRCLRVGRFIRRWNVDEVPQFWNVLKGEMSLVGPRPERPEHILRLRNEIENYEKRHAVKPGMTGLAQVRGWRGDTDLNERIKCDIEYIASANVTLDLVIMIRTLIADDKA